MRRAASLILALLMITGPLRAQTQAMQDRLETLAKYATESPMCEQLGFNVASNLSDRVDEAVAAEAASWGLQPSRVSQIYKAAHIRQERMFGVDLETASSNAKTNVQLQSIHKVFERHGRVCLAASSDPSFSKLIQTPAGFDLGKAATAQADKLLETGGLASWQTPEIRARGDLMTLAGTCRSKIGAARSDELRSRYGRSDDPRTRDYYSKSFDEGLADPTIIETLAGCNRAIIYSQREVSAKPP